MNKTMLIGRLTKDPELRYTNSGTAVCSFTLAVNRRYKGQDGQQQADFISCQAWQNQAENIAKYMTKGSQLGVVGRIQTRTWDDNEGKRHYVTEIVVEESYFLDSKKQETTAQDTSQQYTSQQSSYPEPMYSEDDDELPF